jgi:hypothetical protein
MNALGIQNERVKLGLRSGTIVSRAPHEGYVSVRWDDTDTTTRVPLNRLVALDTAPDSVYR